MPVAAKVAPVDLCARRDGRGRLRDVTFRTPFASMSFPRSAGVLLHPTSLPGANGVGELGTQALKFLDFMSAAGLKVWQMLPL